METSIGSRSGKKNRKKRRRKGPKDSEINLKRNSKSPSRHLHLKKLDIQKKKSPKVEIPVHYLGCVIGAYEQISSAQNQENQNFVNHGQYDNDVFEQTVDLCCDDSSVDNYNSSLSIVSPLQDKPIETVIDLSRDIPVQNEVIDLTDPVGVSQDAGVSLGPTVIDITEDESSEKPNMNPKNEEIFVIGTFSKSYSNNFNNTSDGPLIKLSNRWNNLNNIINQSDQIKRKHFKKHLVLSKICDKSVVQYRRETERTKESSCASKVAVIGENVYINSPVILPSSGLRPIIIDGSNVAYVYSNSNFSCKRLEICINYFKEKGHKVTAFVPQFRINSQKSDNPGLLRKLERRGDVVLTPSKRVDGKNIVPYDDRFIVQTAALKGGVIVTRDNYNDLLKENPAWAETIKYRTLAFTWVDDVLMFPKDPLGEYGPSLEEFLRFH